MRVLFMGTPAFAVPSLRALARSHDVVAALTRQDRGAGRGRRTAMSAVKEWALQAGVTVEQPATLRSAEAEQMIAAYEPEIIIVVAYGLILPAAVLAIPPRGCVNLHASLLPRHRGAAPIARAVLEGDAQTGVTTMLMDEGLDTGAILLQQATPIGESETAAALSERLSAMGAPLLLETIEALQAGDLAPRPQDDRYATAAPSFKKTDGEIDWHKPAVALDRQVRALQPWPGTFTHWGSERLSLWKVEAHAGAAAGMNDPGMNDPGMNDPGVVAGCEDDGIWVRCGEGDLLRVIELQRAGGRRQTAAEFLRGRRIEPGERFGDAVPAVSGD